MSIFGTPPPQLWEDWISDPPAPPAGLPSLPTPGFPNPGGLDVVGTFTGTLFDLQIPFEQVQPVLPAGVEMPASTAAGQRVHVNLAVGYQHDVTLRPANIGFVPELAGFSYMELVLGIPGVQHQMNGSIRPFGYLGELALDQEFPTELGRMIGLAKTLADYTTGPTKVDIVDRDSQNHHLNGEFQTEGNQAAALQFPEALNVLQTFAFKVICPRAGGFWAVPFWWKWHEAVMQRVSGTIEIFAGMGQGQYAWDAKSRKGDNVSGAWRVHVPWEMFFPGRIP